MAVLSVLPHTDQPSVTVSGDRAERRNEDATKPAQVSKPPQGFKDPAIRGQSHCFDHNTNTYSVTS